MNDYIVHRLSILFTTILTESDFVDVTIARCDSCGVIFSNPRLTQEEVKTKYRAIAESEATYGISQRQPMKKEKRAARIFSLITKTIKRTRSRLSILDYGGAEGYNLYPFRNEGHSCSVIDYETFDYPDGIVHIGKDVQDIPSDQFFDVILLCHTLEHVPKPMPLLRNLVHHLSDGGILCVEVPLGCWFEWKRIREPLTHCLYFSEESLFKCLRKAELDIVSLSTSYQWVTHGKTWCINAVGRKSKNTTPISFKTTKQQMGNFRYALQPLMYRPVYYMRRLVTRVARLLRYSSG